MSRRQMAAFEAAADARLAREICAKLPPLLVEKSGDSAEDEPTTVYAAVVQARAMGLRGVPAIALFVQCTLALGRLFPQEFPWAARLFDSGPALDMLDADFEMAAKKALDSHHRNGS